MATETSTDSSFWESIGDRLSSASEWVSRMLLRVFGESDERYSRKLGYIRSTEPGKPHSVIPGSLLARVNELEPKMQALSDDELRGLTPQLRERLAKGEALEDLLPEAFAACREAGWRTKKMRHFDVQILGGVVLHRGNIAEMVTGEGKTLVATLPAYLNALAGQGVHVITVNDYLARRDCEWMLPIYRALGMSAGYIQSDQDPMARRAAYDCDITYGTNSEYGFDFLRDNMKPARWGDPTYFPFQQQCQKALNFAIIDEVDNILVDEARTPLIISGQAFSDLRRYTKANDIAVQLTDLQRDEPGRYYEIKEKEHTCHLTDEGIHKAEELAGVESFYTAGNMEWPHLIDNALKAHHLYKKDVKYAVMRHPESGEMSIIIIDEFTGRLMIGRQWSDGLHQAVEAKHARDGVKIKEETQTLATVTIQNFFKLYKKIAGMTGTAKTEANEFWKIYKLEVITIPTNKPLSRVNKPDLVYRTAREKWTAVLDEIEKGHKFDVVELKDGNELVGSILKDAEGEVEVQERGTNERQKVTRDKVVRVAKKGRPILIGTTDVDKSLKLSDMLKRRGVKHELLNALPEHAQREAEIVAQAGRLGAVTISTNMAGRGTDIILGGNPETLAWARLKDKYPTRLDVPEAEWKATVDDIENREKMREEGRVVAGMGGLAIVGTERHEARRIDNQLRGRAGRQGDPGTSRFYLSLEDDLMRIFAGEWVKNWLTRLGMEEGQAIESGMVSRQIEKAQKRVEERNFDIRKNLLEYDEVMDTQRKRIYGFRQDVLDGCNCKSRILRMIDNVVESAVERFLDDDYGPASFAEFASNRLGVELDAADFAHSDFKQADRTAKDKSSRQVETQVQEMLEENLGDEDSKQWNWQALTNQINSRWGLKVSDRDLKKIGKEGLADYLMENARKSVEAVDLTAGKELLESDWGRRSTADWFRLKFQVPITAQELHNKTEREVRDLLHKKVSDLYRQKEVEFPVQVGMLRFMAERSGGAGGGQRYDREGLYGWAKDRFPGLVLPPGVNEKANGQLSEEDFRTLSRARLHEQLKKASEERYPKLGHDEIDEKLEESFRGTKKSEAEDARELAEWAKAEVGVELAEKELTGVDLESARDALWNAFDEKYRPEMKTMERSLLLSQLDGAWKNHLYTMDHLRSVVGLRGYAQEDPKIAYKREGMKEFEQMWGSMEDRVTESVFRMEEAEGFQDSLWQIGAATHAQAPRAIQQAAEEKARDEQAATSSGKEAKKPEPIRNRGERVGRNDPCPCGSGKKYKNCHMKLEAGAR